MYNAWTASAKEADVLARELEAHLNEFADHVVSVSYAVTDEHHVLVVYIPVEPAGTVSEEAAVEAAEHILDGAS